MVIHTTHSLQQIKDGLNYCMLFFSGKQNTYMILPHYMKALLESTIGGLASQTWVGIASTNVYSRSV